MRQPRRQPRHDFRFICPTAHTWTWSARCAADGDCSGFEFGILGPCSRRGAQHRINAELASGQPVAGTSHSIGPAHFAGQLFYAGAGVPGPHRPRLAPHHGWPRSRAAAACPAPVPDGMRVARHRHLRFELPELGVRPAGRRFWSCAVHRRGPRLRRSSQRSGVGWAHRPSQRVGPSRWSARGSGVAVGGQSGADPVGGCPGDGMRDVEALVQGTGGHQQPARPRGDGDLLEVALGKPGHRVARVVDGCGHMPRVF